MNSFSRFLSDNTDTDDVPILLSDPILNMTNSTTDDIQITPFVSTEYFYNLLPCYIFIITALYRFFTIYKQPSFREKVQATQQETQLGEKITDGENESKTKIIVTNYQTDFEQLEERTASYFIKTRISFANSILYIISVIFAFIMPASLFSAAIKPVEGLFYLFGMVAWYFSGKLIKVEFEKGLNQEIYTHRLFWVFTGSLSLIRIFQRSEVNFFHFFFFFNKFDFFFCKRGGGVIKYNFFIFVCVGRG